MSNNIDLRFQYVWSGANFPYVNLMSVASVLRHHPDARICIAVVGEKPQSLWFDIVENLDQVEIEIIIPPQVFAELPEDLQFVGQCYDRLSATALSARSNLIRYALLYLRGGIYLDFDVLVVRSMKDLLGYSAFIGEEVVWASDEQHQNGSLLEFLWPRNLLWLFSHIAMWCDSHLFHGRMRMANRLNWTLGMWSKLQLNNAVIGSARHSDFLFDVLSGVSDSNLAVRYSTGPTLVESVSNSTNATFERLSPSAFYSIPPGQTYRLFYDANYVLPCDSYCIHYAASNHKTFVDNFSPTQVLGIADGTVMHSLTTEIVTWWKSRVGDTKGEFTYV